MVPITLCTFRLKNFQLSNNSYLFKVFWIYLPFSSFGIASWAALVAQLLKSFFGHGLMYFAAIIIIIIIINIYYTNSKRTQTASLKSI